MSASKDLSPEGFLLVMLLMLAAPMFGLLGWVTIFPPEWQEYEVVK